MSAEEESLARIPAAERTALRLCWEFAASPFLSLPAWSQWQHALSWEQAWLPLSKAGENKQTAASHGLRWLSPEMGLTPHQVGF